jgi:hypothetical protein
MSRSLLFAYVDVPAGTGAFSEPARAGVSMAAAMVASAAGLVTRLPGRRAFGFACFRIARFAVVLLADLTLALPCFALFVRAAARFFALAIAISLGMPLRDHPNA